MCRPLPRVHGDAPISGQSFFVSLRKHTRLEPSGTLISTDEALAERQYRRLSKRVEKHLAVDGKGTVFWDYDRPDFWVRV